MIGQCQAWNNQKSKGNFHFLVKPDGKKSDYKIISWISQVKPLKFCHFHPVEHLKYLSENRDTSACIAQHLPAKNMLSGFPSRIGFFVQYGLYTTLQLYKCKV